MQFFLLMESMWSGFALVMGLFANPFRLNILTWKYIIMVKMLSLPQDRFTYSK